MNIPKVSVIIPVYNVEQYLQRCIDSMLAQTYSNIEFIFVDDGSTDASCAILERAAQLDNRIYVYTQKNAGASAARNTGITHSTGKYIMFCDSDDTVAPCWCDTMMQAVQENPYSWIACGINVLSENGAEVQAYSYSAGIISKDEYYTLFTKGLSGSVNNKIFSSEIIREHDICFDESYMRGEDVDFNLKYLDCCNSIYVIAEKLYNYYRYDTYETLTNNYHEDDFVVQTIMYRIRKPYISAEYWYRFQLHYWHVLMIETERTMTLSMQSLFRKLCHNNNNIRTREYRELLNEVGREEIPTWQVFILNAGWYPLYWFIQKAAYVKRFLLLYIQGRKHE